MGTLDRLVVKQLIDHALAVRRGGFFRGRLRSLGLIDEANESEALRHSLGTSSLQRFVLSPTGTFRPDLVRRRLGVASGDGTRLCPARGWGMVLAGKVLLELRHGGCAQKTVSLLREGDVWSVPVAVDGVLRCVPRIGAELMCLEPGYKMAPSDPIDVLKNADCSTEVFCRHLTELPWVQAGWGGLRVMEGCDFTDPDALSAVLVEIDPGCRTELHWHLNADEWQIVLAGEGVMTRLAPSGELSDHLLSTGISGHVPKGEGHFIVNRGQKILKLLKLFPSDHYHALTLPQWLAASSLEQVAGHLGIGCDFVTGFSRH